MFTVRVLQYEYVRTSVRPYVRTSMVWDQVGDAMRLLHCMCGLPLPYPMQCVQLSARCTLFAHSVRIGEGEGEGPWSQQARSANTSRAVRARTPRELPTLESSTRLRTRPY